MPNSFRRRLKPGSQYKRKTVLLFFGVFVLIAAFSIALSRASQSDNRRDNYTIKITAREVVLHATVTDHRGNFVFGLGPDNFQVYEDGLAQKITYFAHEDIPVTVGLVIDNSGSMRAKRNDVIAGAEALARSSNPQDEIFVVNFNENVSFGLPGNVPFTDNTAQLEAALARSAPSGQTALYDAIAAALAHLKVGTRDKKVLVVVSDGGDNASKNTGAAVKAAAAHADALIYTIGIFDEQDRDRNPRALQQLAKESGGEAFFPSQLKEIVPICERIAREIRSQYAIAYGPGDGAQDGTFRAVEVKANAEGRGRLSVRTRAGYFAHFSEAASPKADPRQSAVK
ncbi:MAG: VWA domain-containing protein [Candidatus Acidiferrum sp.]